MLYQVRETLKEISVSEIDENYVTAGYVNAAQLEELGESLGFSKSTVDSCKTANKNFRSGVEIYDEYTFTELRIINPYDENGREDCVALYIKKNLIIVVDVEDYDESTKSKFLAAVNKYNYKTATLEKIIYTFIDSLITNDFRYIEDKGIEITEYEEDILKENTHENFNLDLLHLKKEFLKMRSYYEQLLDITDAIEENENNIFDSEDLRYISNLGLKITRLREDTDSLSSSVTHLQDAYSASLDLKLNNTMKIFTVITSIFYPLTVIVGWYGMNFKFMPEFNWKFGYIYVIVLSLAVVAVLSIIGKKKKWF
jgi:magnesium transporter